MLIDVGSSKFTEPAKTPVYEFESDTVLRAHRSPSKQQRQPSRIEDYEPGHCSLAVSNGVEVKFSLCPFYRPFSRWTSVSQYQNVSILDFIAVLCFFRACD